MKLISAQSTFATSYVSTKTNLKTVGLTAVCREHGWRPTHWAIALPTFLHLDQAAHAEEVPALQPDRLEGNARADHT